MSLSERNRALLSSFGVEGPETVSEFRLMRETMDALLDAARSEPHDPSSLQKMQTTPQAVGSGEVPRAAEDAACAAYRGMNMGQQWTLEPAMRAALKAALPYLRPSPSYDPTKSLGERLCEAWQAALPPSGWVDKVEWSDFGPDQQAQWERAALNFTSRLSDAGER